MSFFVAKLQESWKIFRESINNEASARFFINSFMSSAVRHVQKAHPSMRLGVEEDFDGSRGYGFLDYLVECYDIVVLVTEAKLEEILKGIAQNLMQLHTALEVSKIHSFSFVSCHST
jgi:hypothetical protein